MDIRSQLFEAFAGRPHPGADVVRDENRESAARLREILADKTASEISVDDVNALFEGNLWLLTPEAFLHYLPALMYLALTQYKSVSVFASELVGVLTKPERRDVEESLERLEQLPPGLTLSNPMVAAALRKQQLEWFDSGTPTAAFEERFGDLTEAEGAAILAFLEAFRDQHGEDFPFDELDTAIDRHWARYRG
jgi:hypothetical protein